MRARAGSRGRACARALVWALPGGGVRGELGAGLSGARAGRAGRERARPGEQGFGPGGSARAGRRKGWGRPVFVTGGERSGSAGRAGKEREKREERKEKREKKRKKIGKRNGEGKEKWEKGKGRGACAPAATAAAVGHARRWSRVRGPGEVRHAERGGRLRQESERPGRACSAEEEREKGGREKKRGREIRGDDRDGWSRVTRAGTAVRKKREGFGRRKKDRWTRRKESGVGKRVFGTGKSFRELGF